MHIQWELYLNYSDTILNSQWQHHNFLKYESLTKRQHDTSFLLICSLAAENGHILCFDAMCKGTRSSNRCSLHRRRDCPTRSKLTNFLIFSFYDFISEMSLSLISSPAGFTSSHLLSLIQVLAIGFRMETRCDVSWIFFVFVSLSCRTLGVCWSNLYLHGLVILNWEQGICWSNLYNGVCNSLILSGFSREKSSFYQFF